MTQINGVYQAPWETFYDHRIRAESEAPYNEEFIKKCREKALEYNEINGVNGGVPDLYLLSELFLAVPFHKRSKVFSGLKVDVEHYVINERRRR